MILEVIGAAVAGFVGGVLVGRRNVNTVNTAITDVLKLTGQAQTAAATATAAAETAKAHVATAAAHATTAAAAAAVVTAPAVAPAAPAVAAK